jgi:hypothetical protein
MPKARVQRLQIAMYVREQGDDHLG